MKASQKFEASEARRRDNMRRLTAATRLGEKQPSYLEYYVKNQPIMVVILVRQLITNLTAWRYRKMLSLQTSVVFFFTEKYAASII